jgi:Sulfotransferase family
VSPNPYVFVVGCPRSGTTLLQRLLDAHPELAVINETLWITREGDVATAASRKVVERLYEHRRFERLGLPREAVVGLLDEGPLLWPELVSRIFDLYGRAQGKRLVGDKSPGYVREIPRLDALWPAARFVHLIRDGRDVWLSVSAWQKAERNVGSFATWADHPLETAALWWERSVRLGREAGEALGSGRYFEVRYEDVVARTRESSRDLCTFLALPFDPAMLRFYEGRTRTEAGLSSKRAWLPPTSGLRDWRSELDTTDVERFEAAAGTLLGELGYELQTRQISTRRRDRALRAREEFGRDARARGRALPAGWGA